MKLRKKLQRIGGYTSGWHFGKGSPMDPRVMDNIYKLHRVGKTLGLLMDDVFPHEDGDVSIMFKAGNHYLEVLCLSDETFYLTLEKGDRYPFMLVKEKENASWLDVLKEIVALTTLFGLKVPFDAIISYKMEVKSPNYLKSLKLDLGVGYSEKNDTKFD